MFDSFELAMMTVSLVALFAMLVWLGSRALVALNEEREERQAVREMRSRVAKKVRERLESREEVSWDEVRLWLLEDSSEHGLDGFRFAFTSATKTGNKQIALTMLEARDALIDSEYSWLATCAGIEVNGFDDTDRRVYA